MINQVTEYYLNKKKKENRKVILEGAIIFWLWIFTMLVAMVLTGIVIVRIAGAKG